MTPLLIALGAAVGAPLRYLTDRFIQSRHRSPIPWGTLAVNGAASFILGIVVGASASSEVTALVATGFCGALSTYSTFSYETMRLGQTGQRPWALGYVALSLILGIAAASVGWLVGAQ